MNRKGHIGTLLLVLGALVLVTAGLFAFSSFGNKIKLKDAEFRGLSLESKQMDSLVKNGVREIVSKSILSSKDSSDFELSFNNSLKRLSEIERIGSTYSDNNVFAKIAKLNYILKNEGSNYTLEIKDLFYAVKSEDGLNVITRNFALRVIFDKERVVSVDYE